MCVIKTIMEHDEVRSKECFCCRGSEGRGVVMLKVPAGPPSKYRCNA